MKKELRKAIIDFIFENEKDFQLTNATKTRFKLYIYTSEGDYLIGGQDVSNFIDEAILLITEYK